MIQQLVNPKTDEYLYLKKEILSSDFPWYYVDTTVPDENNSEFAASPYFSHAVLKSPGNPSNPNLFPIVSSGYSDICNKVLYQIFEYNKVNINSIIRINFNLTLPLSKKPTQPHYDHNFPHKNLLIYFNKCDGDTVVCGNESQTYSPIEDNVIIFEGLHHHYLPSYSRRIVLISTFI